MGMRILLLGLALLEGLGCVSLKTSPLIADIMQCAQKPLADAWPNLLAPVEAILRSNTPDWQAELLALESLGVNMVVCAVSAAVSSATAAPTPGIMSAANAAAMNRMIEHGHLYLVAKGVRVP